jgi:oxygen-independent coproporphyrinogen-3 oxidase
MDHLTSVFHALEKIRSVYIHWPFCPYRCFYCPFVALAGQDQFMEQYHHALVREIQKFSSDVRNVVEIKTLYLGGGTPSTYPLPLLLDMFGILKSSFAFAERPEITIEVNPGTVIEEQMSAWSNIGINRVSIGVQSFNETTLNAVNRKQTVASVRTLLQTIFRYIKNVSVDIILGLPGVTQAQWKAMVQELVSYPLTHISLYILEVHDQTQLFYKVRSGELQLPHEAEIVELFYWSRDFLASAGFEQYELSNFARDGHRSQHNSCYWERNPFKGFGLGAWSFDGIQRVQNEKSLLDYCEKAGRESIEVQVESVSDQQARLETLMLGLRRREGVLHEIIVYGSDEAKKEKQKAIDALIAQGLMKHVPEGRLALTPQGLILENKIVAYLS